MAGSAGGPIRLSLHSTVGGRTLVLDYRSNSLLALDPWLVEPVVGRRFFCRMSMVSAAFKTTLGDAADSCGSIVVGTRLAFADRSLE